MIFVRIGQITIMVDKQEFFRIYSEYSLKQISYIFFCVVYVVDSLPADPPEPTSFAIRWNPLDREAR